MDKIKERFDNTAESYDDRIVKSAPFYTDMIEALVLSLPFEKDRKIKIADLGCGTGTISKRIKEHYPNALISCVDFADNMIKVAKGKLKGYDGITYVVSDCLDFDFSSGYDAVVSSLALHHLHDRDAKNGLYKKIFAGLNSNAYFYNADLVLGSSEYLQNLNLQKWREFLLKSVSESEIEERWKKHGNDDHPFMLMDEIECLKKAGFKNVDVIWKYYHFAVYGGRKG